MAESRKSYSQTLEKYNTLLESFLRGIDVINTYLINGKNETIPLLEHYESIIERFYERIKEERLGFSQF